MSNRKRLSRPQKRAAARAVAAASQCQDCGAVAGRPRRERRDGRSGWVVDVQHLPECPARRLPGLRDSMGLAAVKAAHTDIPLAYLPDDGGVVIAR